MPFEQAFSENGITGTPNCNHLLVASFEALQLLKSAYHNGHIAAGNNAARHLSPFLDSLESNFVADCC
jgi:hypothetical protein